MNLLHIAGGFAQHDLYTELVLNLARFDIRQTVYAPVRSLDEERKQPVDVESKITFFYRSILQSQHRLFFNKKISHIKSDLLNTVSIVDFDIIHAHTLFSDGAVAYSLFKSHGIPYIVAVRNTDINLFMKFRPDLRGIAFKVLNCASKVVFISHAHSRRFHLKYNKFANFSNKASTIPNGISDFWLQEVVPKNTDDTKLNILFVGSINKNKNLKNLILAVDKISDVLDVKLNVVGKGDLKILDKKRFKFINYIGYVTDKCALKEIYRRNDIFVMPSFRETFGVVYIEALSQGLPIVFSENEGFDGYCNDPTICSSVNPHSVTSIHDGILRLTGKTLMNQSKCNKFAQEFSWSKVSEQYRDVYNSLAVSPPIS